MSIENETCEIEPKEKECSTKTKPFFNFKFVSSRDVSIHIYIMIIYIMYEYNCTFDTISIHRGVYLLKVIFIIQFDGNNNNNKKLEKQHIYYITPFFVLFLFSFLSLSREHSIFFVPNSHFVCIKYSSFDRVLSQKNKIIVYSAMLILARSSFVFK
jgi:hypothetical protein